jgi:tRNA threonylcarbamoyl adenosine modification protein YjeE
MHSKTSKQLGTRNSLWKAEHDCSEDDFRRIAIALAKLLRPGHRVLLDGPLGAGKSTFARFLLESLGVKSLAEGSPTFSLVHHYSCPVAADLLHVDFYRIKKEDELDEMGASDLFWNPRAITLCEWTSSVPQFRAALLNDRRAPFVCWEVRIEITGQITRSIEIFKPLSLLLD